MTSATHFDFDLSLDLDSFRSGVARRGYLTELRGTLLRGAVPDAALGDICRIHTADGKGLAAEIVGFDREVALLMPLGVLAGIRAGAEIEPLPEAAIVPVGDRVQGRVIDALGRPLDGHRYGPLADGESAPLLAEPPNPLDRAPIERALATGVRAIDGLLTVGVGQRMGIFAAAGCGKSTLLSMIARNVQADRVVLALIGERGREVRGFLEDDLGEEGLARSTVVVSTADQPALLRLRAAWTATAIAEAARARGERVVLMMDSVTRFARALREIGLAAGEAPGRQGYPPSVFAALPRLFERVGNDERGSITAFYTVLVAGDDLEEPVADEVMSLLDGHVILSRDLAARAHYPAIDVTRSKSRVMDAVVPAEQREQAAWVNRVLAHHERHEDKIAMGLYEPESREDRDLVAAHPRVMAWLAQRRDDPTGLERSRSDLARLSKG
ncbi:MAG: FliI/YscN family ATPase [Planctomycetes bacterium]|nr:FliI/YscN family ATPase [Planctomycetota bacterium]